MGYAGGYARINPRSLPRGGRETAHSDPPPHKNDGGLPLKTPPEISKIIESIILQCGNPQRVLELYYWSQLPGFADALRTLAALPEQKRATIQTFFAMIQDPNLLSVTLGENATLTLSSPEVAANFDALKKTLEQ